MLLSNLEKAMDLKLELTRRQLLLKNLENLGLTMITVRCGGCTVSVSGELQKRVYELTLEEHRAAVKTTLADLAKIGVTEEAKIEVNIQNIAPGDRFINQLVHDAIRSMAFQPRRARPGDRI